LKPGPSSWNPSTKIRPSSHLSPNFTPTSLQVAMVRPRPAIVRSVTCYVSARRPLVLLATCRASRRQLSPHIQPPYRSLFQASRPAYYASQPSSPGSKQQLKRTPLYDLHVKNGGTLVDFGGYEMPLEYKGTGISDSSIWTRENASIFDVSHM
jgi:aminomethyltransferase folate-binding domain-containing protein